MKGSGLALSIAVVSLLGCREDTSPRFASGPTIHVLFDERHGLEGGERVLLHEFEIGAVESLSLERGRVRATLRLAPDALEELPEETTFSVESEYGERILQAHALGPETPPLQEGATVEGVDSALELTMRRAGRDASGFIERAREALEKMKRELDDTDWEQNEQHLQEQWRETVEEIERLRESSRERLRDGYRELEQRLSRLAEELEKAGRSEEAKKLREWWDDLLERLERDDASSER